MGMLSIFTGSKYETKYGRGRTRLEGQLGRVTTQLATQMARDAQSETVSTLQRKQVLISAALAALVQMEQPGTAEPADIGRRRTGWKVAEYSYDGVDLYEHYRTVYLSSVGDMVVDYVSAPFRLTNDYPINQGTYVAQAGDYADRPGYDEVLAGLQGLAR